MAGQVVSRSALSQGAFVACAHVTPELLVLRDSSYGCPPAPIADARGERLHRGLAALVYFIRHFVLVVLICQGL
jgi:hypothetical protein